MHQFVKPWLKGIPNEFIFLLVLEKILNGSELLPTQYPSMSLSPSLSLFRILLTPLLTTLTSANCSPSKLFSFILPELHTTSLIL